jgi:hypothetical protein
MITITSKKNKFRRCGVAHPAAPTHYPDGAFSEQQLAALRAEPMLEVVVMPEWDVISEKPAAAAKRGKK